MRDHRRAQYLRPSRGEERKINRLFSREPNTRIRVLLSTDCRQMYARARARTPHRYATSMYFLAVLEAHEYRNVFVDAHL